MDGAYKRNTKGINQLGWLIVMTHWKSRYNLRSLLKLMKNRCRKYDFKKHEKHHAGKGG